MTPPSVIHRRSAQSTHHLQEPGGGWAQGYVIADLLKAGWPVWLHIPATGAEHRITHVSIGPEGRPSRYDVFIRTTDDIAWRARYTDAIPCRVAPFRLLEGKKANAVPSSSG